MTVKQNYSRIIVCVFSKKCTALLFTFNYICQACQAKIRINYKTLKFENERN